MCGPIKYFYKWTWKQQLWLSARKLRGAILSEHRVFPAASDRSVGWMTHGSGSAWRLTRWLPSLPTHPCWRAKKKTLGSRFTAARLRCSGELTLARRKFCALRTTGGGQLLWPRWLEEVRAVFCFFWQFAFAEYIFLPTDVGKVSLTSNLAMYLGQPSPNCLCRSLILRLCARSDPDFELRPSRVLSSGGTKTPFFVCLIL